jgi:UDP-N-acetylmuramoyl-tripeptide--D-alanyl-D-alanine ligase
VVWYGLEPSNDVWAGDVESHGLNGLSFRIHHSGRLVPAITLLVGRHQVYNALAATAVAVSVGMSLEEVAAALERGAPQARLVVREGWNDCTVLDDTYNASPASMQAALDLLAELEGRHVAVLGEMRELGSAADESHRELGRQLAGRAQVLVAVGELARLIADEAGRSGVETHCVSDADAAAVLLGRLVQPSDVVLVKGSRALELDRLVERLTAQPAVAGGME